MNLPFISFLTTERAGALWQFITAILYVVMPLLMIWAAIHFAGDLIAVVRRIFSPKSMNKDENEDYDIKVKEKY